MATIERESDPRAFSVLLVDDSEVRQAIWVPTLEHEGYRVFSALDGEEALRLAEEEQIDLVLLDVNMPVLDGFQVLEILRQRHSPGDMVIIMMTGQDQDEDVVKGFRLGADDYVPIPSSSRDVVLARIHAQLRNRVPISQRPARDPAEAHAGLAGPGSVLDSKYRLDSLIGRGNFGAVYEATHLQLHRQVAVKVLRTSFGADQVALARFQQEGISLSRLQHPNAVSVLDFSVTGDDVTYLVMELLEGRSLEQELVDGPMSVRRCAEIILPVCEVLAEAHSMGIIHRDIKPQNIFLHQGRRGEMVVKVLDFGIAKMVGETELKQQLTVEGNSVGTPAYMAPERFTNDPYDGRVDVYSLAVTLYEMLSGQTPFASADGNFFKLIRMHVVERPKPLGELIPGIPEGLDRLVMSALAKKCAERPTARKMGLTLASVLDLAPPDGLVERRRPRRRPRPLIPPDVDSDSDADTDSGADTAPTQPTLDLHQEDRKGSEPTDG